MGNFTAPQDSENHQKLLSYIRQHPKGGDDFAQQCRHVFWKLNIPGHLNSFGWVTNRLGQFLKLLTTLKEGSKNLHLSNGSFLDEVGEWVNWYTEHQADIDSEIGESFSQGPKTSDNPMAMRGMTRFALYAALFCQPEKTDEEHEGIYRNWVLLLLRFILTHGKRMSDWSLEGYEAYGGSKESDALPRKLYTPARCLRLLTEAHFKESIKALTLEEICGDDDYEHRDIQGRKYIKSLLRYMEETENDEKGRASPSRHRKRHFGRDEAFGEGYVLIDSRVAIHTIPSEWVEDDPKSLQLVETYIVSNPGEDPDGVDVFPGEEHEPDPVVLADQPCPDTQGRSVSAALSAKGMARALRIQAQQLPWALPTLTESQLHFLDERLRGEIERLSRHAEFTPRDREQLEVAVLLLTMLWSGSSLKRAVSLSVHHKKVNESGADFGYFDHGNEEKGPRFEWRFTALTPEYKSNPNFPTELVRHTNPSFWLPDVTNVIRHLSNYREEIQDKQGKSGLFLNDYDVYEKRLNEYLKEVNKEALGEGITRQKAENFLFHLLVTQTGDITAAAYICGRGHYLANTSIFYTTPTLNHLRTVFQKALEPLVENLCSIDLSRGIKPTEEHHSVGARHCVRREAYQSAITKLQADIEVRKNYLDWDGYVGFHNLYTLYTVLMFGFSVGSRGVISPLIDDRDVDCDGLSTYADKDTSPPFHARLIWLPEMVRLQLKAYRLHRERATNWFQGVYSNRAYRALKEPCYFIDGKDNNVVQFVRPSTLREYLREYIPVPVNAHRRYLRTNLLEKGMPIESIDAFMGHWHNGQEPWGPFSSFHFPSYINDLKTYLLPLLEDIGFTFIDMRRSR